MDASRAEEVVPIYSRKDIDVHTSLENRGLKSLDGRPRGPVILHFQGSGKIAF